MIFRRYVRDFEHSFVWENAIAALPVFSCGRVCSHIPLDSSH